MTAELDDWNFVNSDKEIIDRFGVDFYNDCVRACELKKNDIRTNEQKINDIVNFIMHGPGGD
jgi:hypothetical protein